MASNVLARMAVYISANAAEFNKQLTKTNSYLSAFQSAVTNAGATLGIAFGGYQVYQGLKYGVTTLAEFEKQMSTVKAITGETGSEFQKLKSDALALGQASQYTASQVAGLQIEYGRLGFSTKEILASTKATVTLATATGEDLSRSAEIAGSTLRAFQLDASQMGRVTDVMASSFNNSALALDSFAEGIKYVAPVAKATNVSIEETAALMSVLADAGIKGSQAGTSLRRIFTMLTKDGRPLAERLDELAAKGITLADANDEVGLYAQTALLVLSSQNQRVKDLTKTYQNANGEAEKMATIMRDNLTGDFEKLGAAVNTSVLQMEIFIPVLRSVTQAATDFLNNKGPSEGWKKLDTLLQKMARTTFQEIGLAFQMKESKESIEKLKQSLKGVDAKNLDITEAEFKRLTKEVNLSDQAATQLRMTIFDLGGVVGDRKDSTPMALVPFTPDAVDKTKTAARTVEYLEAQIKSLSDSMRKTTSSAEIYVYQKQIEALRVELDKLNNSYRESLLTGERAKPFKNNATMGVTTADPSLLPMLNDPSKSLMSAEALSNVYEGMAKNLDAANKKQKEFIDNQSKATASALSMMDRVGDSITRAIQYGDSWGEAFARVAASVVDQLEAVALSWVVANAAKLSNPLLIGAAIITGSALVKGAFGSIYHNKSNSGSSATYTRPADKERTINIVLNGELKAKGPDLILSLNKARYQQGIIG